MHNVSMQMICTFKKYSCRVASGPGISGNLEKSENFVRLEKSQGISQNLEKLGNLNTKLGKVREFY